MRVTAVVRRPVDEVLAVAGDPARFPSWTFWTAAEAVDGGWRMTSSAGTSLLRFTSAEPGVLDHEVMLEDGTVVTVPFRVVPHPDGAEVSLEVQRTPGQTDAEHEADAAQVATDLAALRALVEG